MEDPRVERLMASVRARRLSRRRLLETGLRLGIASPVIAGALAVGTRAGAAPAPAGASGAARRQGSGGTFTAVIGSSTDDIDPHNSYSTLASTVSLACYEMLIQLKGESLTEFAPMLAQSWEVSPDKSTYTFKLAPNAVFHDGTPCDAQAVKDSFTRLLEYGGGPVEVISRFLSDPKQMEVVDLTTILFNLGQPQPLFLDAMSSPYGPYIVSPKAVQEHKTDDDPWAHQWFAENAVGTGPYVLKDNSPNQQIVFEKFDKYHGGWEGNHFDRIVLRVVPENATRRQLLERGKADAAAFNLTPEDVDKLKGNPKLSVVFYDSTNTNWTILNAGKLKAKEARRGFCYAFPYDEVINGVYKGQMKRGGPLPNNIRGYDPGLFLYQTDLAKAKELILAGGFKEGDSFDYLFDSTSETDRAVAELFQNNVQQMGFKLDLTGQSTDQVENIILGDAPAEERPNFMSWGWWPDYNDPWNQLKPNFAKDKIGHGGSNGGFWVNERFEELTAQAEHYKDDRELDALMKEAQDILVRQDPAAIFWGQAEWNTVLQKGIEGYYTNAIYLADFPFYAMSRAKTS